MKSYIKELDSIKEEIKRNNENNKNLRARSKVIEANIADFLDNSDQPGLKYKNKSYILERSIGHKRKPKKEKEEETLRLLSNMGISDTKKVYTDILALQKGEEIEKTQIKVTKNKRNDY